jgi:uncharacterized protein
MPQRPGIHIHHKALPARPRGVVRCDVPALIAPIFPEKWPTDACRSDFVEIILRRYAELLDHPYLPLFDPISVSAVESYFGNGGEVMHMFGVCLDGPQDLQDDPLSEPHGALLPLQDRLLAEEDIALLAMPWAATLPAKRLPDGRYEGGADVLYDALLTHCRRVVNRFLVMDAPAHFHGEALHHWVKRFKGQAIENKAFGAVYYPWLRKGDDLVPPSGGVLGAYTRSERSHNPYGVGWSPANLHLVGYVAPEVELDWFEAGELAKAAVNPLVVQPGRGMVIHGARTLSSEAQWEFINSRRIVSMIAEQLRRDNEWAVFEENGPKVWKALERDVRHRLNLLWRQGVLTGDAEEDEYEVWCDGQTNPKTERDAGHLNVKVRLRPISTTEHITLDLRLGGR